MAQPDIQVRNKFLLHSPLCHNHLFSGKWSIIRGYGTYYRTGCTLIAFFKRVATSSNNIFYKIQIRFYYLFGHIYNSLNGFRPVFSILWTNSSSICGNLSYSNSKLVAKLPEIGFLYYSTLSIKPLTPS